MMPALALVSREAERPGIRVNLPGRDVVFAVCHPRGAWEVCDDCLRTIARVLAEEMHWSLETVLHRRTECYLEDLGGLRNCSWRRAQDLQLMTATMCYSHSCGPGGEDRETIFGLVDERLSRRAAVVEMPRARLQWTRSRRRWAVAIGVVVAFVALLVFRVVR